MFREPLSSSLPAWSHKASGYENKLVNSVSDSRRVRRREEKAEETREAQYQKATQWQEFTIFVIISGFILHSFPCEVNPSLRSLPFVLTAVREQQSQALSSDNPYINTLVNSPSSREKRFNLDPVST